MNEQARPDLAAMLFPVVRALIEIEEPILADNDLSMWAYSVLLELGEGPVRTQQALAAAIGADKSRLIPILDNLQGRGMITRRPDPSDRRVRLVALSAEGQEIRDRTQSAIQRAEGKILAPLTPGEREDFIRMARVLHESVLVPADPIPE